MTISAPITITPIQITAPVTFGMIGPQGPNAVTSATTSNGTATLALAGITIASFTTGHVVTVTTGGAFTTTSRSGIDTRSTFPPSSHTHTASEVTDFAAAVAATPPAAHTHGNITNAGTIGSTADLVVTTGTAGILQTASRSGIDSRTTFPNDDVTAATPDPTAETIVKRDSNGGFDAAFDGRVLSFGIGGQVFMDLGGLLSFAAGSSLNIADGASFSIGSIAGSDFRSALKIPPIVVSGNVTATSGLSHIVIATATLTDPTPFEGAWYRVIVRNGTATVGGTAYATSGTIIERSYHSGAWANRVYNETPVLGANVSTALSTAVGSAGAFVVNGGALGTPSSGTLTSCTGLPISTGVSGLAANVATFLATPSSANLAAAVTDETGTGSLVFAQNSTLSGTTLTSLERNTLGRIAALTMSQSPPCSLFEDFCGASGAGIFTWTSSGTGSDSVGAIGQNSFGVRRMTTGTTSGNQRRTILAIPSSTIFGTEIRAHFAIPDVTTCDAFIGMEQISGAFGRYFLLYAAALNSGRWILVTGTGAGVFTNFGTNGPANGNFASGKRYRSIMRPINATTVFVKIDEADWNADNWSNLHDANVTITSYTPSADPMALDIRVNTQTNAARSLDIDYISVENTSIVR